MLTLNQVISGPQTKTKWSSTTHTKTKLIDPHTEKKSFSSSTQRTSSVRYPHN